MAEQTASEGKAAGVHANANVHAQLARELLEAELAVRAVRPPSERLEGLTIDDAYEIQRRGRELRVARGARVVGRKVGLTSAAMQEMLGVDQPDFGCLYESHVVDSGAGIDASALIAPRVEAEIGFVIGRALEGPGLGRDDVLDAVAAHVPALEVIDSRVADWRITIVDTIADNASGAMAVLGERGEPGGGDLAAIEMTLEAGGESATGRGEAVLGHPAEPVAWLANVLAGFGERLEPGDIVLPGALARALPVTAGDRARAEFGSLGAVEVSFE